MIVRKQHLSKPDPTPKGVDAQQPSNEVEGGGESADAPSRAIYWSVTVVGLILSAILSVILWIMEVDSFSKAVSVLVVANGLLLLGMMFLKHNLDEAVKFWHGGIVYLGLCLMFTLDEVSDSSLFQGYDADWKNLLVAGSLFICVSSMIYGLLPSKPESLAKSEKPSDTSSFILPVMVLLGGVVYIFLNEPFGSSWPILLAILVVIPLGASYINELKQVGWPDQGLALFITLAVLLFLSGSMRVVAWLFGKINWLLETWLLSWANLSQLNLEGWGANILAGLVTLVLMMGLLDWLRVRIGLQSQMTDTGSEAASSTTSDST